MATTTKLAGKQRTRPHGNDTVTYEQYNKLREEYLMHRDTRKAANISGIGLHTAERYINKGTPRFPSIRNWANDLESKARMERDQDLATELKNFQGAGRAMQAHLMRTIPDIELLPDGERNADGKIEVSTSTFRTMVGTLKTLHELSQNVRGVDNSRGDVNVNVTNVASASVTTPVATRGRALVRKYAELYAEYDGNKQALGKAIADAAGRRIGVEGNDAPND